MQFQIDHLTALDALTSFVERCNYIQNLIENGYPFEDEEQPEAWIQRLILAKYSMCGITVSYIHTLFGGNRICVEASNLYGYPVYIIDAIGMLLEAIQDVEIEDRNHVEKVIIDTIIELRYG